jgi:hypothetical protein
MRIFNARKLKLSARSNKVGAEKITVDGIEFDSKREAKRYRELRLLEMAGEISDLRTQVKYKLLPPAYEYAGTGEFYKSGEHKGEEKMKKYCYERGVDYIADFVYKDAKGETIVEDAKGMRDPHSSMYALFVLKRKMMLYFHGVKVREV